MRRREFLVGAAMLGAASGVTGKPKLPGTSPVVRGEALTPPARGKINVAVAVAQGATVIDFAGPWEVFQDVHVAGRGRTHDDMMPFRLYTVAASTDPITASGGLRILPDFSVDAAPAPDLVVVPALRSNRPLLEWLAAVAPRTDVTMSVCTGAFQLGKAGLLDGLMATTHHDFYDDFEKSFPAVELVRGLRFVENERISTAGGLTSGIDLALRVVERYFGREVAQTTATYMEYSGEGWKV